MDKMERRKRMNGTILRLIIVFIAIFLFINATDAIEGDKDYKCIKKITNKQPPLTPYIIQQIHPYQLEKPIRSLCDKDNVPVSKNINNIKHQLIEINAPPSPIFWYGLYYDYAYAINHSKNQGGWVWTSMNDPYLSPYSDHTLFELAVINQSQGNIVEVGWRKSINTDGTEIFVYQWKNNRPSCYNGCGWVQYSKNYYPGMPSSKDNSTKSFGILLWEGDWWIWYDREWMGYYPGTIWDRQFISGTKINYFGEVASWKAQTNTVMGIGAIIAPLVLPYNAPVTTGLTYASVLTISTTPEMYDINKISNYLYHYGGCGLCN